MAQAAAASEVHALYRKYLRLVRDWPADKVRPHKDMKKTLEKRVEESFRLPLQNANEPFNLTEATKQYNALEQLLNNDFKNKV